MLTLAATVCNHHCPLVATLMPTKIAPPTNAKISALNDQIAKANAENKARIKERLVELRADHDRRVAKLKQAGALIKEALAA